MFTKFSQKILFLVMALCITLPSTVEAKKKLHTIGDSTMANYAEDNTADQRGWCQMLQQFFDSDNLIVNNRGKSGASSKSFYLESAYWPTLVKGGSDQMQAGDLLIIQFAHNDEKAQGADGEEMNAYYEANPTQKPSGYDASSIYRGTTPYGTYKEYIRKFINEAKAMGVKPIVVGGICRKYFKAENNTKINAAGRHNLYESFSKIENGKLYTGQKLTTDDGSMNYPLQSKLVAEEYDDVPYIDLTSLTAELYESYGESYCTQNIFIAADGTHPKKLGATLIARTFAQAVRTAYENETDAKKKAVLKEFNDYLVLGNEITFNPVSGDMGEAYAGMSITKEYNISAFGLASESGTVTISTSEGFEVSTDKANWSSSVSASYTGSTLITSVYVRCKVSAAGIMSGKLTVNDGTNEKSLDLSVKDLSLVQGDETTCEWKMNSSSVAPTSELLIGKEATLVNMTLSGNVGTPTSPAEHAGMALFNIDGGTWPAAEIDEVSGRYIEFKVTVPEGKEFNLDRISYDVCGWGGSSVCYRAYYIIGDALTEIDTQKGMTAKSAISISKDIIKTIGEGESLTIRFYPWLNNQSSAATGKYLALSNLAVHGILANAGGITINDATINWPFQNKNTDAEFGTTETAACMETPSISFGSSIAISQTRNMGVCSAVNLIKNNSGSSLPGSSSAGNCITFTVRPADGFTFVPAKLSFGASRVGTSGGTLNVEAAVEEATRQLANSWAPGSYTAAPYYNDFEGGIDGLAATTDKPLQIRIYLCGLGNGKEIALHDIKVTGTLTGAADTGTKYELHTSVSPEGAGVISVEPEMAAYKAGKEVSLSATKNFGYVFSGWQVNGENVSTSNPFVLTIDGDKQVSAIFEAIPTYTVTTKVTNDADLTLGSITLSPNENSNKYEEGDEITATAETSRILNFMNWEDGTTNNPRSITVDQDMTITANYEIQDFIAVFDASSVNRYTYDESPFAADLVWDNDRNASCCIVKTSDGSVVYSNDGKSVGSAGTPVVRDRTGVVISNINGLYQNGYNTAEIAWQYQFSTKGFSSIRFIGDMAAKNAATVNWKAQYSLDGISFTDIEGATWKATANAVNPIALNLPAECNGQNTVFVRITGVGTETFNTSYAFDKGPFLGLMYTDHSESGVGNVYVLGEAEVALDEVAPKVISTLPVAGATGVSASGKITITYDERIKAGETSAAATLDGKAMEPVWNTRSVSFNYFNLEYGKSYTFTYPKGYVTDKSGNEADALTLTFTVMERQKATARMINAIVDGSLTQLAIASQSMNAEGKAAYKIDATADMPAQYRSIQAAIDDAPKASNKPYIIFIKNGIYRDPNYSFADSYGSRYTDMKPTATGTETDRISGGINAYDSCRIICINKPNIQLIGESRDGVIISTDRLDGSCNDHSRVWYHINAGATVEVQANGTDFHMENLTVDNENWTKLKMAGPQALCFNISGDRAVLNNVRTRSYQDTYYNGGQYNRTFWNNSEIHGAVDFIYGASDVWLEGCTLNINRSSGGFIVAPNHPEGTRWGYVFNNTRITTDEVADPSKYSVWLGRPWHEKPKTVFLHTSMELTPCDSLWHSTMGGLPALWAVYDFHDVNGNAFTGAKSVSRQYYYYTDNSTNQKMEGIAKNTLSEEEVAEYTVTNVFAGDRTQASSGYWNPQPIIEKTTKPVLSVSENVVTWDKDDYAICYIVFVNGRAAAYPTEARYVADKGDVISVLSMNEYGTLSEMSDKVMIEGTNSIEALHGCSPNVTGSFDLLGRPSSKNSGLRIESGRVVGSK